MVYVADLWRAEYAGDSVQVMNKYLLITLCSSQWYKSDCPLSFTCGTLKFHIYWSQPGKQDVARCQKNKQKNTQLISIKRNKQKELFESVPFINELMWWNASTQTVSSMDSILWNDTSFQKKKRKKRFSQITPKSCWNFKGQSFKIRIMPLGVPVTIWRSVGSSIHSSSMNQQIESLLSTICFLYRGSEVLTLSFQSS